MGRITIVHSKYAELYAKHKSHSFSHYCEILVTSIPLKLDFLACKMVIILNPSHEANGKIKWHELCKAFSRYFMNSSLFQGGESNQ